MNKFWEFLSSPENRPSWITSTLSQAFILAAGSYLVVSAKIAWLTGDMSHLKWGAEVFGVSYLTARVSGKNGAPPPTGGTAA